MHNRSSIFRYLLQSSVAGFVLFSSQAVVAQNAAPAASASAGEVTTEAIIVTGSIIKRNNLDTTSPIVVLGAVELEKRGIVTIDSAIQSLATNGAGNLPNSFTANGAFASGASGVSLRGLTTNSTLVLFNGLRASYYPLADDGTRNFVDLNTIPQAILERVEVLQDGASSTYGADAIAGVVNVITKKTFKGFAGNIEGGISQQSDAGEYRFSGLYGYGDLGSQGYNFYVSAEYQHDAQLNNSDRGFPFNSANLSSLCAPSLADPTVQTCRRNNVQNGIQADGSFIPDPRLGSVGSTVIALVQPYDLTNQTAVGNWRILNSSAGCRGLPSVTISPAAAAAGGFSGVDNATLCQQDLVNNYGVIAPSNSRFSASARLTVDIGSNAQAYASFNYYQNESFFTGIPANIRDQTTPGPAGTTFDTQTITLPVYVCAARVNCSAANGTLNPNNPFASLGQGALISYRFGDIPFSNDQFSHTYRGAIGIAGSFGKDWNYRVDATAHVTDLRVTQRGYVFVQHLLDVVADGSYNFVDPSRNTQAVRDYVSPVNVQDSNSELYQVTASLDKKIYDLPGGPLQLAIGADARYESIFNPSANPDNNGPTNRYFLVNPFGTIGHRDVQAGYFEVNAPIIKQLELNVSGRYDTYSTGQSNFSPKYSGKFKPIDQVTFRATFSQGFRIPSLAESNSLPTTGFVTSNAPPSFQAAHGNNGYGQNYQLGLTTAGTAGLRPEKSDNFTVGAVVNPVRWLQVSADFYSIKKTDVITGANYNVALNAYYAGQPIPAGYQVTPGLPDQQNPNAQPTVGFIRYGFVNANAQIARGLDFAARANLTLPYGIRWSSNFSASYILQYDQRFPDGSTQHYAGTIGPYVITSASGTPRLRGNWSNTFDYGKASLTTTVYYTDGYEETAEDIGGTRGDCFGSAANTGVPTTYRDGITPVSCNVRPFIDVDMHGSYELSPNVTVYADILNLFDSPPPYDPTTYGGYNYNPAWANAGIVGRYFKFGAKFKF